MPAKINNIEVKFLAELISECGGITKKGNDRAIRVVSKCLDRSAIDLRMASGQYSQDIVNVDQSDSVDYLWIVDSIYFQKLAPLEIYG
jgi:hypothetical protein